jgi:predicted phosphoribosyltransferase
VRVVAQPLVRDRSDAGGARARELEDERGPATIIVGLARGGVEVAAEVAGRLDAPLDVVAVRKIGHPRRPEYGLGAVTPGQDGVYVRAHNGLTDQDLAAAVEQARSKAAALDARLHAEHGPLDLGGKTVISVDDGLATGGTMIAALRWARARGAARVVAAVPVAAEDSLALVRAEADRTVCLHALRTLLAVGVWYARFPQVDDTEVVRLVDANRRALPEMQAG